MKRVKWGIGLSAAALVVIVFALGSCGNGDGKKRSSAKPENLTVLFSSDLLGKIRSCGCAVQDMGGVGRRATYTDRVRASVRNLIAVDAGDVMTPDLSFSQAEAELAFDALNVCRLDALTPGEADFVFGLPFLQSLAGRLSMPVIAANIVDASTGERVFGEAYTVRTLAGGLRVGITAVIDEEIKLPTYVDLSKIAVLPAEQTLRQIVPELEKRSDFLILLSHMGLERSISLARRIGAFDLIVVGHGKPALKQLEKEGKTILLAAGGEGQYIGRIDLSLSNEGEIVEGSLRIIALEDTIKVHEAVKDLFARYGLNLTEKEGKPQR